MEDATENARSRGRRPGTVDNPALDWFARSVSEHLLFTLTPDADTAAYSREQIRQALLPYLKFKVDRHLGKEHQPASTVEASDRPLLENAAEDVIAKLQRRMRNSLALTGKYNLAELADKKTLEHMVDMAARAVSGRQWASGESRQVDYSRTVSLDAPLVGAEGQDMGTRGDRLAGDERTDQMAAARFMQLPAAYASQLYRELKRGSQEYGSRSGGAAAAVTSAVAAIQDWWPTPEGATTLEAIWDAVSTLPAEDAAATYPQWASLVGLFDSASAFRKDAESAITLD